MGLKGQKLRNKIDELLERSTTVLETLLESEDPADRALGGFRMAKYGLPGAKAILLSAVNSQSMVARQRVASGMCLLGAPAREGYQKLLPNAVADPDRFVQIASLQTIAKLQVAEAAPAVIAAISDKDEMVRHAAISAAEALELVEAVGDLLLVVNQGDAESAQLAAFALSEIQPKGTSALTQLAQDDGHKHRLSIRLALHRMQPEKSPELIEQLLSDEDLDVRRAAATALAELQNFDSTSLFIRALENPDIEVRKVACKKLFQSAGDTARQALHDHVEKTLETLVPKLSIFRNAPVVAGEIQKLGPAAAEPLLKRFMAEKDLRKRNGIATALSRLPNPKSVPTIVERLKDASIDSKFRQSLEYAIGTNLYDGFDEVVSLLQHEAPSVRESGVRLLSRLRDDRSTSLLLQRLQDSSDSVRGLAAQALAQANPPHPLALPVLARMVRSENAQRRNSAISSFSRYTDDESVLLQLIELTRHRDPRTQSGAIFALGRFQDEKATEAILNAWKANPRNAMRAIPALRRQETEASIRGLAEFMKSQDRSVRKRAYDNLRGIDSPLAQQVLASIPDSLLLPPGAPSFYKDTKHRAVISGWGRPVDGAADCSFSLIDKNSLRIETSEKVHSLLTTPNQANAPMVLQEVVGNFSVEVALPPTTNPENNGAEGLVVMSDLANVLRLERRHTVPAHQEVYLRSNLAKMAAVVSSKLRLPSGGLQLRLERENETISTFVRQTTGDWEKVATQSVDLPNQISVGIYVTNSQGLPRHVLFTDLRIHQPVMHERGVGEEPPRAIATFNDRDAKRLQEQWAKHLDIPIEVENSIGMRFRLIPPGQFVLGSPNTEIGRRDSERQHLVHIGRPFYLGVHEVTQEQYRKITGVNPNSRQGMYANKPGKPLPVTSVDWRNSFDFCRKLSNLPAELNAHRVYRLPSGSEWEFACRAGTNTAYHFGSEPNEKLASCEFATGLKDIGSYPPNAYGLYDMHGNVTEWCEGGFHREFHAQPLARLFPDQRDLHMSRGGSFADGSNKCRSATRFGYASWSFATGFRVALAVPALVEATRAQQEKIRVANFVGPRHEGQADPLKVEVSKSLRKPISEIDDEDYLRVTRLSLWHKIPINDFSLLAKLKNLEQLSLSTQEFADDDLQLLKGLNSLKYLSLTGANIGGEQLVALQKLTNLETLNLSETKIDDESLAKLASLISLKSLFINSTGITDAGLKLLANLTKLEHLQLRETDVGDLSAPILKGLKSLKSLDLSDTKIGDDALSSIARLPQIERLRLANTLVTSRGVSQLQRSVTLKSLNLSGTSVGNEGLLALGNLKQINYLVLDDTNLGDEGLRVVAGMADLTTLSAAGTAVTDVGISVIQKLTKLHTLGLGRTKLKGHGLAVIEGNERLGTLSLAGSLLNDNGMKIVASLPRLYVLDVSNTKITDEGLKLLEASRNLRMITLSDTSVRGIAFESFGEHRGLWSIDARGAQIESKGLVGIGKIPRVRRLLLDRTPLQNKDVPAFSAVRHVSDISLGGTKIDADGIAKLVTVVDSNGLGLDKSQRTDDLVRKVQASHQNVNLYLAE